MEACEFHNSIMKLKKILNIDLYSCTYLTVSVPLASSDCVFYLFPLISFEKYQNFQVSSTSTAVPLEITTAARTLRVIMNTYTLEKV